MLTLDLLSDGSVEDMVERADGLGRAISHATSPYLISTAVNDARVKEIQSELGITRRRRKGWSVDVRNSPPPLLHGVGRLIVVGGETSVGAHHPPWFETVARPSR